METSDSEADKTTPRPPDPALAGTSDTGPAPPSTPGGGGGGGGGGGSSRANAPTLLTLNQLKAGELIQRIQADTSRLLDTVQSLVRSDFLLGGGRATVPGVIAGHPGLLVAQTLSRHLAVGVDELVTLCHDSAADAEQRLQDLAAAAAASAHFRDRERRKRRRRHRTDSAASHCHPPKSCRATSTPQWRNGPGGLW
ncbi:hypothetical protein LX36DRAFT_553367, partial [Colletotrichum falcatum]